MKKKTKTKKIGTKAVAKNGKKKAPQSIAKGKVAKGVAKSPKAKPASAKTTPKKDFGKTGKTGGFNAEKKSPPKKVVPVTLRPGMKAPDFLLATETGAKLGLKDFVGKKLVLFFYPKDMTPGCTQEACDFRDSIQPLRAAGAEVIGVSKDSISSHEKFKSTYSLPFPLLADVEGTMCEAYGVWKEKSLYGRNYMGIERTTVVVGADGKILKVFEKVKVDGHVKEVLNVIQSA